MRKLSRKALLMRAIGVSASLARCTALLAPFTTYQIEKLNVPSANADANFTFVLTGGSGRVSAALKKACDTPDKITVISGTNAPSDDILKKANAKIAEGCVVIIDGKPQSTQGNAHSFVRSLNYAQNKLRRDLTTLKPEIVTSWYQLPRAVYEINNVLPNDISFSARAVGNCKDVPCSLRMSWKEGAKILARKLGYSSSNRDKVYAFFGEIKTRLHRETSSSPRQPSRP